MDEMIFFWQWEESFIVWLQNLGGSGAIHGFLIWLNNFFSFLGEEYVAVGVMGVIYWGLDKKRAERIGFAVLSSMVCNTLVKNRFKRLRPWLSSDKISLLREVDGYSFPSAHSSSATSLYPTLACEYKEHKFLRIVAVVVPLLIAVSRNYLGAHWPTDVITGLLMGLVFFAFAEMVMPRIGNRFFVYFAFLAISIIGFFYCTTEDFYTNYGLFLGFTCGMLFDEKVGKFENTKNILFIALRTLCGGMLFFALNVISKAVLGGIFEQGTKGYLLMRTVRYGIVVFLILGVYPMAFKPVEKFINEKILKKGNK